MGEEVSVARARSVETVIIGGGHAGLTMSWFLRQAGREHVVLEQRDQLGGGWQDRWDGFRLVSPNWTTSVPGFDYAGDDPDGYMPRDEIVDHFRRYAAAIEAPVERSTAVTRLEGSDRGPGFHLSTSRGDIEAREVIVATGGFQQPRIPPAAAAISSRVVQVHSHEYRNPDQLPEGGVLLVGSGQTGVQLAEELLSAGRSVVLAVGHCGRIPRRYRGHDIFWWLRELALHGGAVGTPLPRVDTLPDPRLRFACNPHLTGHGGGHETNLRRYAMEGIRLAGRFADADGERVRFAPDLAENLAFADTFFETRFRSDLETFIERRGLDLEPESDIEVLAFDPPEVTGLDLADEDIGTVIWTSGYRVAYDWIDFPIQEESGLPIHTRGVTQVPGLTFIGLPWQWSMGSTNLVAYAQDAAYLAERW